MDQPTVPNLGPNEQLQPGEQPVPGEIPAYPVADQDGYIPGQVVPEAPTPTYSQPVEVQPVAQNPNLQPYPLSQEAQKSPNIGAASQNIEPKVETSRMPELQMGNRYL